MLAIVFLSLVVVVAFSERGSSLECWIVAVSRQLIDGTGIFDV